MSDWLEWGGVPDETFEDGEETMVDLGGGMVVPLRELLEDSDE